MYIKSILYTSLYLLNVGKEVHQSYMGRWWVCMLTVGKCCTSSSDCCRRYSLVVMLILFI